MYQKSYIHVLHEVDEPVSLEDDDEGEEGDDHDRLDVEDHVDGVGKPQIGLLHDQLGEGPPDTGQETRRSTELVQKYIISTEFYNVQTQFLKINIAQFVQT